MLCHLLDNNAYIKISDTFLTFYIRGCGKGRESDRLRKKRTGKRKEGMESKQEAQEESEETSIVLARRTSITLEDRQRGLGIVEEVAALMAAEHGWSLEDQERMVEAYRAVIERQ